MYPHILRLEERITDYPVEKKTQIYVAGFEIFETKEDSTLYEVLWEFYCREFPNLKAKKEDVLACFYSMNHKEVLLHSDVLCFGHVLYI